MLGLWGYSAQKYLPISTPPFRDAARSALDFGDGKSPNAGTIILNEAMQEIGFDIRKRLAQTLSSQVSLRLPVGLYSIYSYKAKQGKTTIPICAYSVSVVNISIIKAAGKLRDGSTVKMT